VIDVTTGEPEGEAPARRGLVLGAGGVLGAAWTIGAMSALQQVTGWDPRDAEVIVGTSAGSVVAALLASGAGVADLREHQLGRAPGSGPLAGMEFDYDSATGGPLPPWPHPGLGSGRLLVNTVRHPRKLPLTAIVSAFLPPGRGSLGSIGDLIGAAELGADSLGTNHWPPARQLRITAMDYATGDRTVFDGSGEPEVGLADAVVASCSIPGWFPPVRLDGHRYVDGGMYSPTNVDVLADDGLDEVFVLAPMASRLYDSPSTLAERLERSYRHRVSRRMLGEVRTVRSRGARVSVLCPGPEDLHAIGANLMDYTRRRDVLDTAMATTSAALAAEALDRPA